MEFREVRSILEPVILKEVASSKVTYPQIGYRVIKKRSNKLIADLFDSGAVKMCVIEMVREKKLNVGLCGILLIPERLDKRRLILA